MRWLGGVPLLAELIKERMKPGLARGRDLRVVGKEQIALSGGLQTPMRPESKKAWESTMLSRHGCDPLPGKMCPSVADKIPDLPGTVGGTRKRESR